ncbi:MAG TPA: carboxypeptidase-like regulatory domain-containing protein, partial [Silvibacterium sp.]|nr:carboxypeptidase-like regulatory domain-containing protein [Silvibacterium sp.]
MVFPRDSKKQISVLIIPVFVAIFLTSACLSWAQSGRGTLTGSVKDSTGAIVPNAPVTLTDANTGANYDAQTNAAGIYNFPELQPGLYNLSVSAAGFSKYSQTGINVTVGTAATVNVALTVGAASQTVTVKSDASQLQTESSDIGTTVPTKLIEDLPLQFNGQVRNPLQFVQLTPGYSGIDTNSPTVQGGFKL